MDKWETFLTIVTIVSFMIAVCGPMLKLNTTLTRVLDKAEALEKSFEKTQKSNDNVHDDMWDELEDHGKKLNDHETRIRIMEGK